MVLAALGEKHTEAELVTAMSSYVFGTPASHVKRLNSLGYKVQYSSFSLEQLEHYLKFNLSPIVFVKADELPWANFSGFHALVLVKITKNEVMLHDPTLEDGPCCLAINTFMLAWEEFDCLAAVISR